jgi:hypothetical protein
VTKSLRIFSVVYIVHRSRKILLKVFESGSSAGAINSLVAVRPGNRGLIPIDIEIFLSLNPLKPNDPYRRRTAPLTSKRRILYIYSTNTVTEYFKHGIYSLFFPLQNSVSFINLTYIVSIIFTFYIRVVLN